MYRTQLLRFSFYLTGTFVLMVYVIRTMFSSLQRNLYLLDEKSLIKKTPYRVEEILFSEVSAFRFTALPLGFGYGRFFAGKKKIVLPLCIRNLADCIDTILLRLNDAGKQTRYDQGEIGRFREHALIAGFHLTETGIILRPFLYIFLGFCLAGTVSSIWFWNIPVVFALIWILVSAVFPCIGFLIAYSQISARLRRCIRHNRFDDPGFATASIYKATTLFTLALYLISGIFFRNLWYLFIR
jgi:hypothetical protein